MTFTAVSPSLRTGNNRRDPTPPEGFIRRLFDTITPSYDLFNRVSSFGLDQAWRRRAVRSLSLVPGMRVLDLASGTGDLARLAAEALVPLGEVIACDPSSEMLRFAGRKFGRFPAARWHIRRVLGKAEELPFASSGFDAATLGFALRNVADLKTTFLELFRVLRPGGQLALLEFGRPRNPVLALGHRIWLGSGVPVIGALTTGRLWPFLYLRRSVLSFLEPGQVVQRLQAAGFSQVRFQPMHGGVVFLYSAYR